MDKSCLTKIEFNILEPIHIKLIAVADSVSLSVDALCNAILIDYIIKYESDEKLGL